MAARRGKGFPLALGLVILLALLVVIAVTVPASLLVSLFDPDDELRLRQVEGSLWQGQSRMQQTGRSPANLSWKFSPPLEWRWNLEDEGMNLDGTARPGASILVLKDVKGTIRANRLDLADWLPNTVPVGELNVALDHSHFSDGNIRNIQGQLRWMDAGLRGAIEENLGQIDIHLETDPSGITGRIQSASPAPVTVRGSLHIHEGVYEIDLWLRSEPGRPELARQLGRLGERQPDGQVRLQRQGRLY